MKVEDLLLPSSRRLASGSQPEMDPLREADALQEAQLVSIRFDALTLTVGLLFELRQALQLRTANTAVVSARGVQELTWSGPDRDTDLTAWSVGGSTPRIEGGIFSLTLGMWPAPGAQLRLVADVAAFFAGDVPGLAEAPPDYHDALEGGEWDLARWDSELVPLHAVFLDLA